MAIYIHGNIPVNIKYFNIKGNDDERKKFIEEKLLFWGNLKDEYKVNVLDFYVAYFDLFDSFDEYCEKVYLIGASTVSEINNIKVDSSNIKTTAQKYWGERKRKMSKFTNVSNIKKFVEAAKSKTEELV